MNYAVITPIRDEERYIGLTLESMAAQTVKPVLWVLVDDGSSDQTGAIIDRAAEWHPWIRALHRTRRATREAGSGVIAAFYAGWPEIANQSWDCVVKCDGDISFAPDFFERCLREFEVDPKLGIGGGVCCRPAHSGRQPEFPGEPFFHVRGPMKIYRKQCFADIGGLIQAPGWDTVDQLTANMLGWRTRTFGHIPLVHHRATGGAYGSWKDATKNGLADYITGYHPVFMACKCLRRFVHKPGLESLGLAAGFARGYVRRIPRAGNREMIRYVRREQWRALTLRPSLWKERAS